MATTAIEGIAARLIGVAAVAWLALAGVPAAAHAVLVEASIGDRNFAAESSIAIPAETGVTVTLHFNAELEPSFFKATLLDVHGAKRPLDSAPGADRTSERVKLPPLAPGKYAIAYKVLAADSHLTEAILRFTVVAAEK